MRVMAPEITDNSSFVQAHNNENKSPHYRPSAWWESNPWSHSLTKGSDAKCYDVIIKQRSHCVTVISGLCSRPTTRWFLCYWRVHPITARKLYDWLLPSSCQHNISCMTLRQQQPHVAWRWQRRGRGISGEMDTLGVVAMQLVSIYGASYGCLCVDMYNYTC